MTCASSQPLSRDPNALYADLVECERLMCLHTLAVEKLDRAQATDPDSRRWDAAIAHHDTQLALGRRVRTALIEAIHFRKAPLEAWGE